MRWGTILSPDGERELNNLLNVTLVASGIVGPEPYQTASEFVFSITVPLCPEMTRHLPYTSTFIIPTFRRDQIVDVQYSRALAAPQSSSSAPCYSGSEKSLRPRQR